MISMTWPEYLRHECRYKGWLTPLTPLEAEVLSIMLLRSPNPTTADTLIDALWGDDPDGGPEDARRRVCELVAGLRAKLPGAIGSLHYSGWDLGGANGWGCRARRLAQRKEKNHDRPAHGRHIDSASRSAAHA
jgi:hypothetical protein